MWCVCVWVWVWVCGWVWNTEQDSDKAFFQRNTRASDYETQIFTTTTDNWYELERGEMYNGKIWLVLYLANEPFERYWRILIWCLWRGYYSIDVAVHWKFLIWRFLIWQSTDKFAKSPN